MEHRRLPFTTFQNSSCATLSKPLNVYRNEKIVSYTALTSSLYFTWRRPLQALHVISRLSVWAQNLALLYATVASKSAQRLLLCQSASLLIVFSTFHLSWYMGSMAAHSRLDAHDRLPLHGAPFYDKLFKPRYYLYTIQRAKLLYPQWSLATSVQATALRTASFCNESLIPNDVLKLFSILTIYVPWFSYLHT